jgi:hypothetical protein
MRLVSFTVTSRPAASRTVMACASGVKPTAPASRAAAMRRNVIATTRIGTDFVTW